MAVLTTEQVISVIEEMNSETGKIPTQREIKDKIGGSYSTIGPVLRDWREKYEENEKALNEMPNVLREAMDRSLASIWKAADNLASEKVDQYKKIMDQQREDHEVELVEMEKAIDELLSQLDKKEDDSAFRKKFELENSALKEKISSRDVKIDEQKGELDKLTLENKNLVEELLTIAKGNASES